MWSAELARLSSPPLGTGEAYRPVSLLDGWVRDGASGARPATPCGTKVLISHQARVGRARQVKIPNPEVAVSNVDEVLVLAHFIASDDVERSRRLYTEVPCGRVPFSSGESE